MPPRSASTGSVERPGTGSRTPAPRPRRTRRSRLRRGRRLLGLLALAALALALLLELRERRLDAAEAQARGHQLTREELRVGLRAGVDAAVLVGLDPVALRLAVLREQDQRRGVGGLGREGQVEQDERVRVPPERDE